MNPVLINDLRKNLFRRKPVLAVAYAALAILTLTLGIFTFFPVNAIGKNAPLWRFPDLVLPIVAPAFAAGAFAKEYEQHTWQDVMLTRLSVRQILGGKFFASLLPTLVSLIVLFPPFALLLILENVKWALEPGFWMAALGFKFLLSATFSLILVLVCSYHCRNTRTALVVGYVTLFVYGLLNYALWIYVINPLFNTDYPLRITAGGGWIGDTSTSSFDPLAVSLNEFGFSVAEGLHLLQAGLFSFVLFCYLAYRLHHRRMPLQAA